MAAVSELGCEMAQGFYLGRPMRGDLVADWIHHHAAATAVRRGAVTREWPERARV
jgi:predicted signal transduction protein with EAL and GGDEF domain